MTSGRRGNPFPRAPPGRPRSGGGERGEASATKRKRQPVWLPGAPPRREALRRGKSATPGRRNCQKNEHFAERRGGYIIDFESLPKKFGAVFRPNYCGNDCLSIVCPPRVFVMAGPTVWPEICTVIGKPLADTKPLAETVKGGISLKNASPG